MLPLMSCCPVAGEAPGHGPLEPVCDKCHDLSTVTAPALAAVGKGVYFADGAEAGRDVLWARDSS